ncbi:18435_t:CDS:10 [Dentiscutata erythropus]|uniref:Exocyst complex component SEC15 n=1 Tax=Dentiscutata erythropus TaxID=1348616 RepID=A0A9N9BYN9_9GLOM|nr:18435_t:CDS:10 [Dentiscutata erythropus]
MSDHDQQQLHSLVLSAELNSENENVEQLGPIIKSIYDTERQEAFLEQLATFVRKKEGEIERMCNSNYQEFVHSVDQLLKVRQGTVNLKNKIIDLNYDVQKSGKKVAAKKKELIQTRKIQKNIDEAVDTFQLCLHVLDMANRVNHLVEERKYYSALRVLEELQTVHLRKVIQYDFAKHMHESIPVMQNSVKDAVTKEMKEWLYRVREVTRQVGKIAMEQMSLRQKRWKVKVSQNPDLRSVPVSSPIEIVMNEENEFNIINNDEVLIDFKPLYQCLHIHEELGKLSEFKTNYEEDRRAQANLVLSESYTLRDSNEKGFEAFLQDVVGFFVIEQIIVQSTQNFRSRAEVDSLWNTVIAKVVKIVAESLDDCRDPELFQRIKFSLFTFIQTLEDYGYNVNTFTDLVLIIFQKYSDMLKHKFSVDFHQTIIDDDYMPMQVSFREEYDAVVDACWFKEDNRISQGFPKQLPFSQAYPSCCLDIKNFVNQYYEFAEEDSKKYSYVDDIVQQTLDHLLIDHVDGALRGKLQSTNMSLIVQIIINLEYFENACGELEKLLKAKRSSHRGGKIKLYAIDEFRETRKKAEKRIFELVNSKIDDFLEIADLILNPDVKKINSNAIINFDLDVTFLENFARGLDDPNIADAFLELRQIVTLLQVENAEEYLDPSLRNRKYSHLRPADVVNLFEKWLRGDQTVVSMDTEERARKRAMEGVVRSLRLSSS